MLRTQISEFLVPLLFVSYGAAQQYEYVVIGSGPGGGPLAVDLARAGHSVLLLEAGSDLTDDPIYEYPRNFSAATNDPRSRWDFFVKHSDDAERDRQFEHLTWRMANGSFYVGLDPPEGAEELGIWYPRAATLGGCAMHNAARLDLPSDGNWDHIADITGDASWRAAEMRKIYQDIENCHYAANGTAGHGFGGWLDTSREGQGDGDGDADWVGAAADGTALLRAVTRAVGGAPANATDADLGALVRRDNNALDPGRDQATGVFGLLSHTTPDGRRRAPAHYVRETLDAGHDRFPLTVELDAFLTRVVFDTLVPSRPPAAMAVEYVRGASAYRADPRHDPARNTTRGFVYATREVIVAGGALNSPQILKLSGVGPAEELERHNITLIRDLPGVGTNLGDNYESSVVSLAAKPFDSFGGQYAVRLKTAASQGIRDIFMWVSNVAFEGHWPGFPNNYGPNQVAFGFTQTDPRRGSEGTVTLRSGDPFEPPDINFRFFETGGDEDLRALTEAVRFAHRAQGNISADSGLAPFDEIRPCEGRASNCTDARITDFLRLQASSHHASGTCAIGADDDPMAVLDSKFRVRGVDRLRVVDASVFPKPPGAFPVLPTFMISRKAAKVILEDVWDDRP